MSTFVFPGQGSQIKEMGKDVFGLFPELVKQADEILGYSICELCLEDSQQQLNQTQFTQPALYTVNALTYFAKLQQDEESPAYVTGHSLGEYNALLAAEVIDFGTGLQLVKKRGELMSQAKDGAMLAIIGLTKEAIKNILTENDLMEVVIANDNSFTQQVLSGRKTDIEKANGIFKATKAKMVIPLKVSGAFHSPLMQTAQQQYSKFLQQFNFSPAKIPVIANVTAKPYETANTAKLLAEQIVSSVRWTEIICYLLAQNEQDFIEIGPGNVLTGLIRRIKNNQ